MGDPQVPGPFAEWLRGLERGEKQLPNCDGERHHYTPEFLLKKFRGPGHKLFQLDKNVGSCEEIKPKDAAWHPNLYAVDSATGEHDGMIEGFFSIAENFAADSLNVLLNAPAKFTDEDRGNLAFLLAIQEQRAPGYLAEWEENLAQMGTVWATVELANTTGPKGTRRRATEAAEALVSGAVNIRPTRENILSTVMMGLAHTVPPAYGLPWTLLLAKEGAFVTSDRPLTMHDPAPPHKFSAAAWLSSEFATTTMPLSSRVCLRISPTGRSRFSTYETRKQVERINLRTYGWASTYVYGRSEELLLGLHALALAKPDRVPIPTVKRMVLLEDLASADPAVAEKNAAKGWNRYVTLRDDDGGHRLMSYEVISSIEDARQAVAPRKIRATANEMSPSEVRNCHPRT